MIVQSCMVNESNLVCAAVGYVCECPSGFGGDQCHIPDATHTTLRLSLGVLAAVLVWCAFLLREWSHILHILFSTLLIADIERFYTTDTQRFSSCSLSWPVC